MTRNGDSISFGMKLIASGITNHYSEDIGKMSGTYYRTEWGGFCGNKVCIEGKKRKGQSKVMMTQDQTIKMCPGCGHALFWKKVGMPVD